MDKLAYNLGVFLNEDICSDIVSSDLNRIYIALFTNEPIVCVVCVIIEM